MKPEVSLCRKKVQAEFKIESVKPVRARVSVRKRPGPDVDENVLRKSVKEFGFDPISGHGQMKHEQRTLSRFGARSTS
jgi:hypothetical protein